MHPRIFGPLAGWALRLLHRPPLEVTLGLRRRARHARASSRSTGSSPATGAWLLARAITGLGVDALPLVIVAYALAYVAGMVAFFIPSGIGVREAVLTASLSQGAAGRRRAHLGAAPAPVGDRRRAGVRRPRRRHRAAAAPEGRGVSRRRRGQGVRGRGAPSGGLLALAPIEELRRRADEGRVPPPRPLRDRRRHPLRGDLRPALVAQVQGVHGRPLRPRQHGPGRVQHGARPLPRDHQRRPRAAADVAARLARRPHPRAVRAPLARVAEPRDAARRRRR